MEKKKKILIIDNLFNRDYLKLTKSLAKFFSFYTDLKLNHLISHLKKKFVEKLDINIITNRETISIKSQDVKVEKLSHFRVKLDHSVYLNIIDNLMKENKRILTEIFNTLRNLKNFYIEKVFIGDVIELELMRYLNQIFGEYELVNNILISNEYDSIVLFCWNPDFFEIFKNLNKRFRNIEIFSDSVLNFNNNLAILSHIKYLFSLLILNLRSFWFKKINRKKLIANKDIKNILIIARTKNQIESIKPLYFILRKDKKLVPIIYNRGILNNFIPLQRFNRMKKFLKINKQIWVNFLGESARKIKYDFIKLTSLIKDFYNDKLFYLLIHIFNDLYYFDLIIKANAPSLVIITNDYKPDGRFFTNYSKILNIPTIHIPHSAYPIFHQMVSKPSVDYYALDCERDKEYIMSQGKSGNKIIVTGRPRYEPLFKNKINKITEVKGIFSSRTYDFKPDKFTILLATNTLDEISYKKIFSSIILCLNDLGLVDNFVIKLHPSESGQLHKKIFNQLGVNPIIVKDYNILDLIYTCDLLLARQSTTILEAMIIGTPAIKLDLVNLDFIKIGSYLFVENDFLINVKNQEELAVNIENLYKNKTNYNNYSKGLKEIGKKYSFYDKKSGPAEKVLKLIRKILFK